MSHHHSSWEAASDKMQEESAVSLCQLVTKILSAAKNQAVIESEIYVAANRYTENFFLRYGSIKILGMTEPILLEQIYTTVLTIAPQNLNAFEDIAIIEANFRKGSKRQLSLLEDNSKFSGVEAANNHPYLCLLGAPGSGKSTFLRRMGLEALLARKSIAEEYFPTFKKLLNKDSKNVRWSEYSHDRLPILIELRRFKSENLNLVGLIKKELEVFGFLGHTGFTEDMLKNGHCLILLDGIDEIPGSKLDSVIEEIRGFTDRYAGEYDKKTGEYSGNRFIISCRTAFHKNWFAKFKDIVIADFDQKQIKTFAANWFSQSRYKENAADEFFSLLISEDHEATLELAKTPLLLTFLCVVYDDRQRLPANRSRLYKRAFEILLERWAAEKRVHNEPLYAELDSDFEVEMLAEIAGPFFEDNKLFFTEEELLEKISEFIASETQAPKKMSPKLLLDAIQVQQGLLIERAAGIYSFSHLTIQEYLCALYIISSNKMYDVVRNNIEDKRWREVILLISGTLNRSDLFLEIIVEHTQKSLIRDENIIKAVKWAEESVGPRSDTQMGALLRIIALFSLRALFSSQIRIQARFSSSNLLLLSDKLAKDRERLLGIKTNDAEMTALFSSLESLLKSIISLQAGRDSAAEAMKNILKIFVDKHIFSDDCGKFQIELDAILKRKPTDNATLDAKKKFRYDLLNLFKTMAKIHFDIEYWPEESHDNLESLLYVYILLMSCKDSALRCSVEKWNEICLKLATV